MARCPGWFPHSTTSGLCLRRERRAQMLWTRISACLSSASCQRFLMIVNEIVRRLAYPACFVCSSLKVGREDRLLFHHGFGLDDCLDATRFVIRLKVHLVQRRVSPCGVILRLSG